MTFVKLVSFILTIGTGITALSAQTGSPTLPATGPSSRLEIEKTFRSAVRDKSVQRVVDLYTEDAVLVPSQGEPRDGRREIESYYQELFQSHRVILTLQDGNFRPEEQAASERGEYSLFVGSNDGSGGDVFTGYYHRLYEIQTDSTWRIRTDVFQERPSAPSAAWTTPEFGLRFLSGGVAALATLAVAFFAYRAGARQWRMTYLTKLWGDTIRFLYENAKYLDPGTNQDYRSHFTDLKQKTEYDLVARLSIAFLDDAFHLGGAKDFDKLYSGSIRLLAGPHREWLKDHEDAYSKKFYKFLTKHLKSIKPTPPSPPAASPPSEEKAKPPSG